jgi:glutathionyl-hydroquinone reductase
MDKTEETEEVNINFEKNAELFVDIKDLCETEEQYQDVVMKISLLEVILRQVNEIFVNSLYNKDTPTLINSANSSVNILREQVTEQYISNSKELNELMPIPGVEELAAWVEEIHYDISRQLYSEGFCNTVILPALQTITESIIEFAQEENENESEVEE